MKYIRTIIDMLFHGGIKAYEKAYTDGYEDAIEEYNRIRLKENRL